jgi:3',5'-cyclic AMP phosphodiesterase CpdA
MRCGVKLKRTPEGGLQFLGKSTPAARVAVIAATVSEREVHLLHISDLHFSASTTWDSDTVLDRLVNDVVRMVDSGKQPDILVVTGDVAYSGKVEEYDLARKWIVDTLLPAANLTTASLVIAGGNHDADRSLVTRSSTALQNELLRLKDQTEIAQVLVKQQDRDVLLARHSAFVGMLNSARAGGRTWDLPWGAVTIDVRGTHVHIATLCSSWMSSSDADKGNLLLGLSQVNEVFQGAKKADLVLAAIHHPWSYIADFDEVSRREVQRNASIVLRGHLHEADHAMQSSPAHPGMIEIAAGATYETSRYSNAYHFITVRLDQKKVRIYPRHWDTQRRDWTADLNVFQAESGELSYGTQ